MFDNLTHLSARLVSVEFPVNLDDLRLPVDVDAGDDGMVRSELARYVHLQALDGQIDRVHAIKPAQKTVLQPLEDDVEKQARNGDGDEQDVESHRIADEVIHDDADQNGNSDESDYLMDAEAHGP